MNNLENKNNLANKIKQDKTYFSFRCILEKKKKNEYEASVILLNNTGQYTHQHIKEIITLVDEPYPYYENNILVNRPWFGPLFNVPNTAILMQTNPEFLNNWLNILNNRDINVEDRINMLQKGEYKMNGISVGFISLMLYLQDKTTYSVLLPRLYKGLKILYPEIGNFNYTGSTYIYANKLIKEFARQYHFEDTEMDWILYYIPKLV